MEIKNKLKATQAEPCARSLSHVEQVIRQRGGDRERTHGFSLVELLTVLSITLIISAIAIPQMISQRRLMRSVAITREILTQLRFARQTAISQRRAYTFQYDDATKQINLIGPIPPGTAGLAAATGYPNNAGSSVVSIPLTRGGLDSGEISYGIPTGSTGLPAGATALPTGALGDGVSKTDLVSSKLNITFQPDGSVIDLNGDPVDKAIFIFNNKAALGTASAVSILGSSGRVKVWRYSLNGNKYAE